MRLLTAIILSMILLLIVSCKDKPDAPPFEPTKDLKKQYSEIVNDILANHLLNGYVVSRWRGDNSPEHLGEGILWVGVFMGSAPCEKAYQVFRPIADAIERNQGQLARVLPISGDGWDYTNRGLNFDGETGFQYGIAMFWSRCPDYRIEIENAWLAHQSYLDANKRELWPGKEPMPYPFTFTDDIINDAMGLQGEHPSVFNFGTLAAAINGWMAGIKVKKASCYRANLAFMHMMIAEELYKPWPKEYSGEFCNITKGFEIPTIDHWCQRQNIKEYLESFVPNQWEFRHQRCGSWETPDGKENLKTPGADFLFAYSLWLED